MKINKTKITTTFFIALLLSSFSCSQGQELDLYQFFPANIGDQWEYTMAGGDQIYTVIRDSIDIKDSSRYLFYKPPVWRGANYRIDKNYNVFNVPAYDNRHVYKLDANVGDTWMVLPGPPRYEARVREINQGIVFGKVTTIMTIDLFLLTRGDTVITEYSMLQYWEKLAYGFGLISREDGATEPFLLRGCRIDGVTYGTVDVEEEPKTIPSEFVLYQNYPNPFNPTTVIGYQLPVIGRVTLRVFDILGREIVTLVNEEKQAGKLVNMK
ncbi:MAG: hypothetical protein FD178_1105 [Ignavibacteria bacterium]|nr:MAG: hypothetical protein FD178_1105 [Ignavibacteria bacterium]